MILDCRTWMKRSPLKTFLNNIHVYINKVYKFSHCHEMRKLFVFRKIFLLKVCGFGKLVVPLHPLSLQNGVLAMKKEFFESLT